MSNRPVIGEFQIDAQVRAGIVAHIVKWLGPEYVWAAEEMAERIVQRCRLFINSLPKAQRRSAVARAGVAAITCVASEVIALAAIQHDKARRSQ